MKGLLLLLGVGAAIYTLLVITHDALPGGKDSLNVQTQPNQSVDEHTTSWGVYLSSRSPSQNPQSATSQQSAEFPAQQSDGQNSERKPGTDQLAASADKATTSESDVMEPEGVEWAKVVLAAQMQLYQNQKSGADTLSALNPRFGYLKDLGFQTALLSQGGTRGVSHGLDTLTGAMGSACLCSVPSDDLRRKVDENSCGG